MSYSQLTLEKLEQNFNLNIVETVGLFNNINPREPPPLLREILKDNVPLAVAIGTEKARSEFILATILSSFKKIFNNQISFFFK